MVACRETFTRGREIFLRGREIFLRGRDVSGLWRETLLERVSATLGATIGATIGATTGVGIIFANLLIISFGVRGVTKNLQERCRGTSWARIILLHNMVILWLGITLGGGYSMT